MDDLIAQFTAITGTNPSKARPYLNLTDGNLEQAIQLFFEDPNLAVESTSPPPAPAAAPAPAAPPRPRTYHEDADGVVYVPSDSDGEDMDLDLDDGEEPVAGASAPASAFVPNTEDDEAMARRLQEEMYGAAGREPEDVRAPIARTSETLVGPGATPWEPNDDASMQAMIAHQMRARQARQQQAGRPGIFNQRDTQSAIWEDADADPALRAATLARATGGASTTSTKANTLAEMFRPPFEIIARIPWDQAREEGKSDRKWLLVNVQDPSVFDCQVLNRDLWKDERVVGLIHEHFIFLQYSRDDPRGNSYMQYYFSGSRDISSAYPHIAIVDPRTGEQVKVWSGSPIPKVVNFIEDLTNFLDRYSLDATAKNPVAKRKPEQPKELNIDRMTEDEMLEMALQNSLANGSPTLKPEDPDDLTKSMTFEGKGKAAATNEEPGEASGTNGAPPATPFSQIASDKPHEEPPANPTTTTRIQFRYSGGRLVRRFSISDPVRRIYEWLKAEPLIGKEGVEFDLMFMGKNLMDFIDATIEEAGLKMGNVNMEFLGQDED